METSLKKSKYWSSVILTLFPQDVNFPSDLWFLLHPRLPLFLELWQPLTNTQFFRAFNELRLPLERWWCFPQPFIIAEEKDANWEQLSPFKHWLEGSQEMPCRLWVIFICSRNIFIFSRNEFYILKIIERKWFHDATVGLFNRQLPNTQANNHI